MYLAQHRWKAFDDFIGILIIFIMEPVTVRLHENH